MTFLRPGWLPYFILALLAVPLFFTGIYTVHDWGDDFSQYIREGLNIAHGKPFYQSTYIFNAYDPIYAPPQYPPGYPLLLAPVLRIWGFSFRAINYLNSVIVTALLFTVFAYFRKYTGKVAAVCLSVLVVYSQVIIYLKWHVLSDITGLLFVTLYFVLRRAASYPWWRIGLLVFCVVMAVLTRSQAILLLLAEILWLVISSVLASVKGEKFSFSRFIFQPSVYIITGSILSVLFLSKVVFSAPRATGSFYSQWVFHLLHRDIWAVTQNGFTVLLDNANAFYKYSSNIPGVVMNITGWGGIILSLAGFMITISKRLQTEDVFFVLVCLLIIYLPVHDDRYFIPVLPMLYYYCYRGIELLLRPVAATGKRAIVIIVSAAYLCCGFSYLENTALGPPQGCIPLQPELTVFNYISAHVNDHDIIVFPMPRALALYTGKRCMTAAPGMPMELNKRVFDSLHVKYILVHSGQASDFYTDYLKNIQKPVDSILFPGAYTLYTLR